ncbi:hypothetical protein SERLA73DRAFT_74585 [Serpula lacrymans var. lacrymans S7.3]|uniref:Uncharacterized protein n=2 Tax=Serpula lacrymans var. lacrymans TaxID=341189 RepID=F8PZN9_SERL3|nr:uncharacterized protein SERLADRAFT_439231 [Serpula lacrymans var. lacrymans S7.9]EGN98361.1 hypothetical protein SERLA73DRAFT_74585 [Serpula lacrymans var. lacrymans S7.3]EGO23918.1 hypothetical protein SERLADRAFT_439231 [Serpula lacrymans var. lacrymans S7.9]
MQQEYSPDRGLIVRTPRAQIPDSATRKAADWYKDDLDISLFAIAPQDAFPTPTTQKMRTLTRSSSPTPSIIGIPPAYSPPQYIYNLFDLDSFNTAVYDARINLSRFSPNLIDKPLNDSAYRRRPRKRRYSRQD